MRPSAHNIITSYVTKRLPNLPDTGNNPTGHDVINKVFPSASLLLSSHHVDKREDRSSPPFNPGFFRSSKAPGISTQLWEILILEASVLVHSRRLGIIRNPIRIATFL